MKEYEILGYSGETGEVFMRGTFYADNNMHATKKWIDELAIYEFEDNDIMELTDCETGEIINTVKF